LYSLVQGYIQALRLTKPTIEETQQAHKFAELSISDLLIRHNIPMIALL
jgi:hypothetical protein